MKISSSHFETKNVYLFKTVLMGGAKILITMEFYKFYHDNIKYIFMLYVFINYFQSFIDCE